MPRFPSVRIKSPAGEVKYSLLFSSARLLCIAAILVIKPQNLKSWFCCTRVNSKTELRVVVRNEANHYLCFFPTR